MKRLVIVAALGLLPGCSNAPIAGFLDSCFPSKPCGPPPERTRNPIVPGVGPNDRLPPPAELGAPTGPPAPGN